MEEKKKKNSKMYLIITILIALILVVLIYLFINRKNNEVPIDNMDEEIEDILEEPEQEETLMEDLTMKIVSPEEETFEKGQARMWKAQLDGMKKDTSFRAKCHWEFYLNEYNEETLYETMENSSIVFAKDPGLCGFTSTFIESRGKLRVKLTAEIQNAYGEPLEIFTAERNYTVD